MTLRPALSNGGEAHQPAREDPPPLAATAAKQEEELEEWMGMMGGMDLGGSVDLEEQRPEPVVLVDKKRLRQLRSKPGWYRRVSQHVSKGAKKRIQALWPPYGIEAPPWGVPLDVPALFAPRVVERLVVEVGFGGGDCLVPLAQELARTQPGVALIGCEWHAASVAGALGRLEKAAVPNVRVFRGDVLHHLRAGWFGPQSVDEVLVVCPDPWPKEADKPRRVVNRESAAMLAACVKPGGYLHVATDVLEYAEWVGAVMAAAAAKTGDWEACARAEDSVLFRSADKPLRYRDDDDDGREESADGGEAVVEGGSGAALPACFRHGPELVAEIYGLLRDRPRWRPVTRYEWRGVTELGHSIYDMCYRRTATCRER